MNNMTEKEKYDYLIEKGFTATEFGKVISFIGKSIGSNQNGYRSFTFRKGKKQIFVQNHRFIWYYFNKELANVIDHINQNKADNRLENLRNVSRQQNAFNTKAKGYTWNKANKKWSAQIVSDYKQIHLGSFSTEEEAREAYLKAKEIYHII